MNARIEMVALVGLLALGLALALFGEAPGIPY